MNQTCISGKGTHGKKSNCRAQGQTKRNRRCMLQTAAGAISDNTANVCLLPLKRTLDNSSMARLLWQSALALSSWAYSPDTTYTVTTSMGTTASATLHYDHKTSELNIAKKATSRQPRDRAIIARTNSNKKRETKTKKLNKIKTIKV